MGKTFTIDPISHKRLSNLGEVDKHYLKRTSRSQLLVKNYLIEYKKLEKKRAGNRETGRRNDNYSKKYPFSSKLYCGFCGSLPTRRNWMQIEIVQKQYGNVSKKKSKTWKRRMSTL